MSNVSKSESPYFILLVGSPGVGKTSQVTNFIKDTLGKSYDDFFHVSLDFIVEKVKPYRNKTREALEFLSQIHDPLTNTNYQLISKYYLPIIGSVTENFGLNKTHESVMANIQKMKNNKNSTSKGGAGNNNKSKKAPVKRASTTRKAKKENNPPNNSKKIPKLYELVDNGLECAIKNGYNIIYDTTFTGKNSVEKIEKMKDMIQTHGSDKKYNLLVVFVSANKKYKNFLHGKEYEEKNVENDQKEEYIKNEIEAIQMRLTGRHTKMKESGFIRAIPPKLVKIFVKDNEDGFKRAVDHYGKVDNIRFIVMYNPQDPMKK
jgi:predicted ABC-type ATPase